ncbi:MAG: DUF1540 domain-containing protein [Clostridiaceae bacterium]
MENNLHCSAANCVHNMNGFCSSKKINIQGLNSHAGAETECESFQEAGIKNAFKSLANINYAGEFKQMFSDDKDVLAPKIACTATNCSYNVERHCSAPDVEIYGPNARDVTQTSCQTFKE